MNFEGPCGAASRGWTTYESGGEAVSHAAEAFAAVANAVGFVAAPLFGWLSDRVPQRFGRALPLAVGTCAGVGALALFVLGAHDVRRQCGGDTPCESARVTRFFWAAPLFGYRRQVTVDPVTPGFVEYHLRVRSIRAGILNWLRFTYVVEIWHP